MNCKVTRHISPRTSNLGRPRLAHQHLTVPDLLPAKALHAQALTGIVVDIFGGTASFDM